MMAAIGGLLLGVGRGGWGVGFGACLAGILVAAVVIKIAASFPRSRRLNCTACRWQTEIACDQDDRPTRRWTRAKPRAARRVTDPLLREGLVDPQP